MKIELSKEQLSALNAIISNTQIQGKDAEFIVELKKSLNKIEK